MDQSTGKQATGVHVPTFVWTMIAVIAGLFVYHFLFNGR